MSARKGKRRTVPSSLQGKGAVVTGASRGAGRAIASVLGERGATVYVTGRSEYGFTDIDGRRVPPFRIRESFVEMVKRFEKQKHHR